MKKRKPSRTASVILKFRREKKLSQGKLAKLCSYETPQYISNAERSLNGISIPMAKKLVELGVPEERIKMAMLLDMIRFFNRKWRKA